VEARSWRDNIYAAVYLATYIDKEDRHLSVFRLDWPLKVDEPDPDIIEGLSLDITGIYNQQRVPIPVMVGVHRLSGINPDETLVGRNMDLPEVCWDLLEACNMSVERTYGEWSSWVEGWMDHHFQSDKSLQRF
jgi:hypothetical protein